MVDNRTASELVKAAQEHLMYFDGTGTTVEHYATYCVAWRSAGTYRAGWAERYCDHGGDKAKAEAAARFQSARRDPWEQ